MQKKSLNKKFKDFTRTMINKFMEINYFKLIGCKKLSYLNISDFRFSSDNLPECPSSINSQAYFPLEKMGSPLGLSLIHI